jgi:hypothetical protein
MKSSTKYSFSNVPQVSIPRSTFDRSCGHKTTFDAGYLIPVFVDEALPGDTFNLKANIFARLATPIHPIMDNLFLDSFFFAVPRRLIWENWQRFNGERSDPDDSIDFLEPQMVSPAGTGYTAQSLHDYFGIPTKVGSLSHSSMFHRAYNLIWNEWFRDENLQDSLVVDTGDGPDDPLNYVLRKRGKRKDYFTSCLPWPQKGPSVSLPLVGDAPITGLGKETQGFSAGAKTFYETDGTGPVSYSPYKYITNSDADSYFGVQEDQNNKGFPNIRADMSKVSASTINELRQAFQIQRLLERDARGGTRYIEFIRTHFGVKSPDARLQRPEYLGGGSSRVRIEPVAQTSSTDSTTPQGNLASFGTVLAYRHGFTKSFTEHCVILGMVSVRADLTYQQGLPRMFSRKTRYDHYLPVLSHLGEQAVLQKEIFASGVTDEDNKVFGYQERFAEYRYKPSTISGQFRSNYAQSLHAWHLSQFFAAAPTLSPAFIQESPPMDRVTALGIDYPDFLMDSFFDVKCARPMPAYSIPGGIDHF